MEMELTTKGPSRKRFIQLTLYSILIFLPILGLVLYSTRGGSEYVNLVFNVNPDFVNRIEITPVGEGKRYIVQGKAEKRIYFNQIANAHHTDILPRRGNEYVVIYFMGEKEIAFRLRESGGKYWMLLSSNLNGGFSYGAFLIKDREFSVSN